MARSHWHVKSSRSAQFAGTEQVAAFVTSSQVQKGLDSSAQAVCSVQEAGSLVLKHVHVRSSESKQFAAYSQFSPFESHEQGNKD